MNLELIEAVHDRMSGQAYYATIDRTKNNEFAEYSLLPAELVHRDMFWAPLKYNGARKNENAVGMNILFADLDHMDTDYLHKMWPHLLWETSPGSTQAIWFLAHSLPLAVWSDLNQRMTYFMNADKGGWHASKLLRVPGSVNYKREDPYQGRVLSFQPNAEEYEPDMLRQYLPEARRAETDYGDPPAQLTHEGWKAHLRHIWDDIDLSTRANLLQANQKDRSQTLVFVCNRMLAQGISTEDIFHALEGVNWNKFADRPAYLWGLINGGVK